MVPSARLELAQLSPLPPQDSVSTNFTTTAIVSRQIVAQGPQRGMLLAGVFGSAAGAGAGTDASLAVGALTGTVRSNTLPVF